MELVRNRFKNKIGECWRGTDFRPNINPSDVTDEIGLFARASVEDSFDAITAAREAQSGWAETLPYERGVILRNAADTLFKRKTELGHALSREEGKTLAEGIAEVHRAAQIFDFFAGETTRIAGEALASVRTGVDVVTKREPVGVVGIITPWNFPIAIPAWKIAPALAFGNTVVFKPAELVPHSAWSLVKILHESGLPDGVLNLVSGPGSIVGEEIVNSTEVNAVSFTGSSHTGRRIAVKCAERLCKVQLEMGGKNPLVVMDDADLDTAVDCAINGAFYSTGQRCTASSRLIVLDNIHDRFVEAITTRMKTLKIGNALDGATDIGPVVDQTQLETDLQYLALGQKEGATLAFGGRLVNGKQSGFYLTPALFTEVDNKMRIAREEIFGPIACVIRAKNFDDALALANDTEFGLTSGICTTNLKYAKSFQEKAKSGMTMVNLPTAGVDFHVPFGGTKGSSYGAREQGRMAIDFYTSVKTCYTHS